ncbi:iron-containing alcohol dehydrogenase, partial [Candidatus Bathyarchaeota archaeon]|nr:iron-containing alcohol dehydrogenase [Candidatus Bathyarchaeota archaeon]
MSSIGYNFPNAIFAGWGESMKISEHVSQLGEGKTFIVTDKGVINAGIIKKITQSLDQAGIPHTVFDGVQPNPTVNNVYEGVAKYREEDCNHILAV